jgi:hypothetical protein
MYSVAVIGIGIEVALTGAMESGDESRGSQAPRSRNDIGPTSIAKLTRASSTA